MTSKATLFYPEPRISKFLFASKIMAPLWTVVRIYLGFLWLRSGIGKVTDPAWVGPEAGGAVRGFLEGALELTTGDHPSVQGWYAWLIENLFIPNAFVMSHLVAFYVCRSKRLRLSSLEQGRQEPLCSWSVSIKGLR